MPNPFSSDITTAPQSPQSIAQATGRRLKGRSALVTGAGSYGEAYGTGKAIARLFAAEGARICVADYDAERAEATRAEIDSAGGDCFVCLGDVSDDEHCRRIVSEAAERFGTLDILVNNVGIGGAQERLESLDRQSWQRVFDVNFKSTFQMSTHAIPHLIASGGGSIINISSIAGSHAMGNFAYGPSKAAVHGLTRELALVYGRDGIRANTIAPGHIYTPLLSRFFADDVRDKRRNVAPLGVEGDAWDVAWAALFLASPEARFISGALLPVDGGVSAIAALSGHDLLQGG